MYAHLSKCGQRTKLVKEGNNLRLQCTENQKKLYASTIDFHFATFMLIT